ncbi:hypothetical protein AMJ49_04515 [Parcubacteria bacterium DG_74_2]|nr:MAG: hypothetical protein AMJ49_04515 [Parcubacteria bacterium DG_74_2]
MKNIAKIIDHTNIKPGVTEDDIKKTCQEAKEQGFRGVCVNPQWVKLVKQELEGADIKVVVLIDPPMGVSPHQIRVDQCQKAKEDGADEIDIVMNIIDLKYKKHNEVFNNLKEITSILPTKVIIGTGYLTDEEVKKASELVKAAGAFCVKTSTERDPLDSLELKEKAKHLRIMKDSAPNLVIKAAGNIRSLKDVEMMVEAGAGIIGTSSGVSIVEQAKKT